MSGEEDAGVFVGWKRAGYGQENDWKVGRMKQFLLGLVLPALLVAVGIYAFIVMGKAEPKKVPPQGTDIASRLALLPEAETETVESLAKYSQSLDIRVTGTVVPFRQIRVAAEVDGRVVFKAEETRAGNYVKKGQLLYRIDPRDYELAVERLTRICEQEAVALRELEQEVANTNRMLSVNKEELSLHDGEIRRLESLKAGVASQSEIDQLKRARLASVNQATSLQNQLLTMVTTRNRLELAEKLAATQLEQAKLNLSRCEIVSPCDGIIAIETAEADSYIRKGESLITIEDLESVEVSCNLRMDELMWVLDQQTMRSAAELQTVNRENAYSLPRTPATIEFCVTGREDMCYRWKGHLDRYDGSGLDPQSRTVPCRVEVDEPLAFTVNGQQPNALRGSGLPALVRGMFVDVVISAKPQVDLLLVPRLAVKPGNIIWKFRPDEKALPPVAPTATDKSGATESLSKKTEPAEGSDLTAASVAPRKLNPDEWEVGYLQVLTKINVVHTYEVPAGVAGADGKPLDHEHAKKYWICEIPSGMLQVADQVVVSPLSGIKGDGTDGLRVRKRLP